jgi:CubicO group peptidase (beta-lactamase class C family)
MKRRRIGVVGLLAVLAVVVGGVFVSYRPASAKAQELEKVLARYHQAGKFDGVALVVERGDVIVKQSFGLANREQQTAHADSTRFRIASLTKLFLATLVMQLHEQGKLRFTDTVAALVPNFPAPWADKVTIHHLLTNTSGLQLYEERTAKPIDAYTQRLSLDEFIAAYCAGPLDYAPGTKFRYNNADYVVLTKVIETITLQPWETTLRVQILDPLNMDNTGVLGEQGSTSGLAAGYYTEGGTTFTPDPAYYAENYFGGGAMYSTIDDLLRFERALHDNTLLSEQSKKVMQRANSQFYNVAYGTFVTNAPVDSKNVRTSERWGSTWGFSSTFVQFVDDNSAIILLSNNNNIQQSATYELKNELTNVLYDDQLDQALSADRQ